MKKHTMKLRPEPFEMIGAGRKTLELRLYDDKRQQIAVGDTITFRCGTEELTAAVRGLHRFPDFAALYAVMPMEMIGYPERAEEMERYYSKEEQHRYGVLGIEIEVL